MGKATTLRGVIERAIGKQTRAAERLPDQDVYGRKTTKGAWHRAAKKKGVSIPTHPNSQRIKSVPKWALRKSGS